MIIRNKKLQSKKNSDISAKTSKSSVIKKEDAVFNDGTVKNSVYNNENKPLSKASTDKLSEGEEFEKIDISSIEFKERIERRRGERRRGYRRIDERSLVSRAQSEAHTIKELAAREGYQNGLKKAQDEIDELKNAINSFLCAKEQMYEEFYPHLTEISFEIAKKIIKQEVTLNPDIVKNIIDSTLDEVDYNAQKVTIKVNPDDSEFASASLPDILNGKSISAKITVVSDDTIEKGSCIVIANNGVIDASFATQLEILQSAFGIYKGGL